MWFSKNNHFLRFSDMPALDSISCTILVWSRCSSTDLRHMTVSYMNTSANCHLTTDNLKAIGRSKIIGALYRPKIVRISTVLGAMWTSFCCSPARLSQISNIQSWCLTSKIRAFLLTSSDTCPIWNDYRPPWQSNTQPSEENTEV